MASNIESIEDVAIDDYDFANKNNSKRRIEKFIDIFKKNVFRDRNCLFILPSPEVRDSLLESVDFYSILYKS